MKTTISLNNIEQVKSAFNALVLALPKNYYVDSNNLQIETSDNAQTSYYEPNNNKIVISFNNVLEALQKLNKSELDIDTFDKLVRGLVYHELSHAFLTPLDLYDDVQDRLNYVSYANSDVINIIEDFRIETTLENYYINTDFNSNRRLILNAPNDLEMLQDFTAYVFGLMRCDKVDKNAVKLIAHFKRNACAINKYSDSEISYQTALLIKGLYNLFMSYQQPQQNKQQQSQSPNNNQPQDKDKGANTNADTNADTNTNNDTDADDNENESDNESDNVSGSNANDNGSQTSNQNNSKTFSNKRVQNSKTLSNDERQKIKQALSARLQSKRIEDNGGKIYSRQESYKLAYVDSALVATLSAIIGKAQGFGTANAFKSYGYSGGFDTRGYIRDMQRKEETCKRFNNKSGDNVRDNKKKTKILNILLDNSGSFRVNDIKTSIILKTLARIEKITAFKFNLYIFGDDIQKIERDNERASYSSTCTEAFERYDYTRLLKEMTQEKTIFLVDGSYGSNTLVEKNLKALDSKNTYIISDYENAETLKKMRLSKVVLTYAYVNELERNIIKAFKVLFN